MGIDAETLIFACEASDGSAGLLVELGRGDDGVSVAVDLLRAGVRTLEEAQALHAEVRRFARYDLEGTGRIVSQMRMEGNAGVMLEISTASGGTVLKNGFRLLERDLGMHITAAAPQCVSRGDLPAGLLEEEEKLLRERLAREGKPEELIGKIVAGKMERRVAELVLLEQPYVRDPDLKVWELLEAAGRELGDVVGVRRFVRWTTR